MPSSMSRSAVRVALYPMPSPASARSEEHTSELPSLKRIPYAVFCLKKKKQIERIQMKHKASQKRCAKQTDKNAHRQITTMAPPPYNVTQPDILSNTPKQKHKHHLHMQHSTYELRSSGTISPH